MKKGKVENQPVSQKSTDNQSQAQPSTSKKNGLRKNAVSQKPAKAQTKLQKELNTKAGNLKQNEDKTKTNPRMDTKTDKEESNRSNVPNFARVTPKRSAGEAVSFESEKEMQGTSSQLPRRSSRKRRSGSAGGARLTPKSLHTLDTRSFYAQRRESDLPGTGRLIPVDEIMFALLSAAMITTLVVLECFLSNTYLQRDKLLYFGVTLAPIPVSIISIIYYRCSGLTLKLARWKRVTMFVGLGMFLDHIFLTLNVMYHSFSYIGDFLKRRKIRAKYHNSCKLWYIMKLKSECLIVSALLCAPLIISQTLFTFIDENDNHMQVYLRNNTVLTSTLLLAWSMAASLPLRKKPQSLPSFVWILLLGILKLLALWCIIVSRTLTMYVLARVFGVWQLFIMGTLWVIGILLLAMLCGRRSMTEIFIYQPALAALYLFAFVNPREGELQNGHGMYYLVRLLTDTMLLYTSYSIIEVDWLLHTVLRSIALLVSGCVFLCLYGGTNYFAGIK